eukprot:SAG22_NODE_537_length_9361_cov_53.700821_8_plen_484_part_00
MAANAVNCIKGEIHNVIASLRTGWIQSARPFLHDFKTLHDSLCEISSRTEINDIDTLMYFEPFLTIIQSEHTSGVVTHVALSAVNKFILYGFLTQDGSQTMEVICRTVLAVSQCRFESIDKTWDEQVYLQVCTVLLHAIISPGGVLLTDGGVWLCIKTCYEISKTESLSDIVCRHAEDVLMQMVLTVCSNVARKSVAPEGGGGGGGGGGGDMPFFLAAMESSQQHHAISLLTQAVRNYGAQSPEVQADVVAKCRITDGQFHELFQHCYGSDVVAGGAAEAPALAAAAAAAAVADAAGGGAGAADAAGAAAPPGDPLFTLVDADKTLKPPGTGIGEGRSAYNSQVLLWVMEWLIKLVDAKKAMTMRAFGLNMINVALETSANVIGHVPSIVHVIGHDLCKFLLQNTQADDVTILSLTLRVIFNLFNSSLKAHLKVSSSRELAGERGGATNRARSPTLGSSSAAQHRVAAGEAAPASPVAGHGRS